MPVGFPALSSLVRCKPVSEVVAASEGRLKRVLGPWNLIALGIGGIIGAGIFATVGTAAVGDAARPGAGPAIIVSFVLTGIACGFAALCYAEFASMVPIAGSAYTYAYTTLGELVAWIIGWDLIIEYAVGNVAVAISWSGYFNAFLSGFGIHFPAWTIMDFRTAMQSDAVWRLTDWLSAGGTMEMAAREGFSARAIERVSGLLADGNTWQAIQDGVATGHAAVSTAPQIFGLPFIFNVPAAAIVAAITAVLIVGIRESAIFNAIMVAIKLVVLGVFVAVGIFYVSPENYVPFAPHGWAGIQAGAAIVFFAYIGFDAVSTAAEETKDPGRNLPIGIIGSLAICTIIYIVVAAVLVGMVPLSVFTPENKAEPLTVALDFHRLAQVSGLVAFGSVIAHTCVLLVFQLGQPRIFFSMSRDGLLPPLFSRVHPRFRTPHVATILTGVGVGLVAGVTNIDEMVDLTNIGTLFAFILVCIGIIVLRRTDPGRPRPFRVPFSPYLPLLGVAACLYLAAGLPAVTWIRFFVWLAIGLIFYFGYGVWHSRATKT